MKNKLLSAPLLAALIAPTASAELLWQDTSFSLLRGTDYEVGEEKRTVFTLEHASGHTWGSTFLFFDRLRGDNVTNGDAQHETYGEVTVSYDLIKSDSFVKKVFASGHVELQESFTNYLVGPGVSLDIPGAAFFNATLFQKNNEGRDDQQQLTLSFKFPIAGGLFVYDGFLDKTNKSDDQAASTNLTTQLKWDIGQSVFDIKPGKLFVGVEYVYWDNKFGIKDSPAFNTDERNANLLIKWHM